MGPSRTKVGRKDPGEIARRMAGRTEPPEQRPGRGATANPEGRFETIHAAAFDDGWDRDEPAHRLRTEVTIERARTIITRNASPDIPFDRSINPYRGCEHGCVYCFARPNHAFAGLSPGLDFETKLFAKPDAAALLERELSAPAYEPRVIALGTATDPYQPIERERRITRSVLEVLALFRHPVGIVTKSNLVTRDIDILAPMAEQGLAKVAISLTTLDPVLARRMEPRAPHPLKRLAAIRELSAAGIPALVLVAPIIPSLNDHEIETLLGAARDAGAGEASYVLLRLPHELEALVGDWLSEHYPERRSRIFSLLTEARGGKAYDSTFGLRMIGKGPYADLIGQRFRIAKNRLGFPREKFRQRCDLFRKPEPLQAQLKLLWRQACPAISVTANRAVKLVR